MAAKIRVLDYRIPWNFPKIDPPGFNLIQCMAHVASNCLPIHFSAYSNFRAYPKIRYLSANTTTILLKNTYLVLVLPGLVMGHITPIFCLFENLYYFLKYSLQIFGKLFDFSSWLNLVDMSKRFSALKLTNMKLSWISLEYLLTSFKITLCAVHKMTSPI